METYQIPKIFFERYVFELSSDAYRLLINFYKFYLDHKEEGKKVSIHYNEFKKQILNYCDNEDQILRELNDFQLVIFFQSQNLYELNLTEISKASSDEHKERFKLIVKGKKFKRKRGTWGSSDEKIHNFVEKSTSRYSSLLQGKFKLMINGIIQFKLATEKKIELKEISDLIAFFRTEENDDLIETICDAYNSSPKYGKVGLAYINGILRNKKEVFKKTQENKKFKQASLDKYKKKKEENDRILGIKIVLGNLDEDSKIKYEAYLKLQDFDGLNRLYKIGIENLKDQKKDANVFVKYDWLKL